MSESEGQKPVSLQGEAGEVALAEATAVLAMVQDDDRRGRLADLIAAIEDGAVQGESAQALEELLELGLQTGPAARALRPGRRAGGAQDVPPPARAARSWPRARARSRRRSRRSPAPRSSRSR